MNYQLNNPMRNRNKGFGVGLSIVELLDHRLTVSSEPGKGSTFAIDGREGQMVGLASGLECSEGRTHHRARGGRR